jgi:hypothetical protein
MKTPAFATEGRHRCQNCQKAWDADELLDIEDLGQRIDAGEPVPSGECPECGALCQPVKPAKKRR